MKTITQHLDNWASSFGRALDRFSKPDVALDTYEKLTPQDFIDLTALFGGEWTSKYIRQMEHARLQRGRS